MAMAIGLSVLDPSLYISELKPRRREAALHELVARAHEAGVVDPPLLLRETLALREKLGSTALGKGVALPNARSVSIHQPRIVVGRSSRGIDWNAPDGQPVHLVLLALSPGEFTEEMHHDLIGRAAAAVRLQRNRQKLLEAPGFEAVAAVLREVTA
jgi:PTS system fructose-specific IIC component